MKRFQTIIQKYITNHQKHKRYLAGVLALSVLVSFGVSAGLIMPAISMTGDDTTERYEDEIDQLNYDDYDEDYDDEDYGIALYSADESYNFGEKITGIKFSGGGATQSGNIVTLPKDDWSGYVSINYSDLKWSDITFGDSSYDWQTIPEKNKSIVYTLPDNVVISTTESGGVSDPTDLWQKFWDEEGNEKYKGSAAGTYLIDKESNTITITFSEGYLKYLYEKKTAAQGTLNFEAEMHRGGDKDNNKNVTVGDLNISAVFPAYEVSLNKRADLVNNADGITDRIKWTITIQNPNGYATLGEVTDEMLKVSDGNYEISPDNAAIVNKGNGTISISDDFKDSGDTITISYYTPIKDVYTQRNDNNELINEATLTIEDGEPISNSSKQWLNADLIKARINKTGTPSYKIDGSRGYIEWTINVERGYGLSLDGYVVTDNNEETGFSKAIDNSITVNGSPVTATDGKITLGDYSSAVIKYKTPVTSADLENGDRTFTNPVTLTPPPGDPPPDNPDPNNPPKTTYTKQLFYLGKSGQEKQTDKSKIVWTITIDANVDGNKGTLEGFTVTDPDFASKSGEIKITGKKDYIDVENVTLDANGVIHGDVDYVEITFERPLTDAESNLRQNLSEGETATATNTVTVEDPEGGSKSEEGKATLHKLNNSFVKNLLSTNNKTEEGSYTSGKGTEENTILDWQIVIENYDKFTDSTLVDIMGTGNNGGKHYISETQKDNIKVVFQTMDGTRTEKLSRGNGFTVNRNSDGSQFEVIFDETYYNNNHYVRAEIYYSTTAETKDVEKGHTETFNNSATYGGKTIPGTDFTFTRTDPSVVPKHSLNFNKSWDRDKQSNRPESIKIQLQRKNASDQWVAYPSGSDSEWTKNDDGTFTHKTYKYETQAATQEVESPYTFKWDNLPQYAETSDKKPYEYRVVEFDDNDNPVENGSINGKYKVSYDREVELTSDKYFNITNTYVMTSIEVEKHWKGDDKDNKDRPPVTVILESSTDHKTWTKAEEITLNAGNNYEYKWDNIRGIDDSGNDIYYRVRELSVDNYTTKYSSNNTEGINSGLLEVTNTYNMMYIKADKYWDDGSGAVKKIPDDIDSIDLELQWKLKGTGFEDLPQNYIGNGVSSHDNISEKEFETTELAQGDKFVISINGGEAFTGNIKIYVGNEEVENINWQGNGYREQFVEEFVIPTVNGASADDKVKVVVSFDDTFNQYYNFEYKTAKKIPTTREDLTYDWKPVAGVEATQHLEKDDYSDGFTFRWDGLDKKTPDGKDIVYRVVEKSLSEDEYTVSYQPSGEISSSKTVKITNKDKSAGSSVKKAIYPDMSTNSVADNLYVPVADSPHTDITSITEDDLKNNWPTRNIDGTDYYIFKWKLDFGEEGVDLVKFEDETADGIINPYFDTADNDGKRFDFVVSNENGTYGIASGNFGGWGQVVNGTASDNDNYFSFDNSKATQDADKLSDIQWITYCTAVPKETIDKAMEENGKYEVINKIKLNDEKDYSPATLTIKKEAEKPPSEGLIEKGLSRDALKTAQAFYTLTVNKEGKNLTNGDMIDISDIFEPSSFTVNGETYTGNDLFDVELSNISIYELGENGKRQLNESEYIYLFNSGETETKKDYSISGANASINNDVVIGYTGAFYFALQWGVPNFEDFPNGIIQFKIKGIPGKPVNPRFDKEISYTVKNSDLCYDSNGEAIVEVEINQTVEYSDFLVDNVEVQDGKPVLFYVINVDKSSFQTCELAANPIREIKGKGANCSITSGNYQAGLEVTYEISGGNPGEAVNATSSDAKVSIISASEVYDSQSKATVVLRLNEDGYVNMQCSVINTTDNVKVEKATATMPEVSKETSLQLSVPDGMPLSIEYTYSFTVNKNTPYKKGFDGEEVPVGSLLQSLKPAPTIAIKNKASFQTSAGEESDEHTENQFEISNSNATIQLTEVPIIKKIDVGNHSIKLDADFYLAMFDKDNNQWKYVTAVKPTTDSNGKTINELTFDATESNNKVPAGVQVITVPEDGFKVKLDSGELYKLIECREPDDYVELGYTADSPVNGKQPYVYYFIYDGTVEDSLINKINEGVSGNKVSRSDITILRDKGTLQVPNSNKFDLVAEKEWGVIPKGSEAVSVELELVWSYTKSSNIPAVTYKLSDLNLTDVESVKTISGDSTAEWEDLPNGKDGRPIYYYVVEKSYTVKENGTDKKYELSSDGTYKNGDKVGDFKPIYSGNGLNAGKANENGEIEASKVDIKNASRLVVKKIWQNAAGEEITSVDLQQIKFNLYGIKADKSEVQLVENGTINESDNWQTVIDNSILKSNLKAEEMTLSNYKNFRVEEVIDAENESVMANYIISDTYNVIDGTGEIILTNKSKAPSDVDVTVKKEWVGSPQNSIQVKLIRSNKSLDSEQLKALNCDNLPSGISVVNDDGVTAEVTLNGNNEWTASWEKLPSKHNNETCYYYVLEKDVPQGYEVSYSRTNSASNPVITITNTKVTEKISITVNKTWVDGNNKDGKRPQSLTLKLERSLNGTTWDYVQDVKLTGNDDWSATVDNLEKYDDNNQPYQYKIVEKDVPDGYEVKYDDIDGVATITGNTGTINLTNTKVVSLKLKKEWSDSESEDHKGDDITVKVHRSTQKADIDDSLPLMMSINSPSGMVVTINSEFTLTVNRSNVKEWSSSDNSVVKIVSNVAPAMYSRSRARANDESTSIQALACGTGTAVITAKCGSETATIEITVEGQQVVSSGETPTSSTTTSATTTTTTKSEVVSTTTSSEENQEKPEVSSATTVVSSEESETSLATSIMSTTIVLNGKENTATIAFDTNKTSKDIESITITADVEITNVYYNNFDLKMLSHLDNPGWEAKSLLYLGNNEISNKSWTFSKSNWESDISNGVGIYISANNIKGNISVQIKYADASAQSFSLSPISLGMLGLKRLSAEPTTLTGKLSEFDDDNVAIVTMAYNSSTVTGEYWYEVLNLPAYAENDEEYYYWVEEDETSASGYIASYKFEDSNGNTHYIQGDGTITIKNTREEPEGVTMPSTGGTGTTWYYITGMAFIMIPVITLARRRKKST